MADPDPATNGRNRATVPQATYRFSTKPRHPETRSAMPKPATSRIRQPSGRNNVAWSDATVNLCPDNAQGH
jgi:hypothetical protein